MARGVRGVTTHRPLPVTRIEPRRGFGDLGLGELRHAGDLLRLMTMREVQLRYVQTLLGPVWLVVNPLVPALLFTFVFTKVADIDTGGIPYLLLVTTAMTPWNTVSRTLSRGGGALVQQRHLLTKVWFPRLLVPLSLTLTSVVDHLVSLAIVGVAMGTAGQAPTWRLVVLPLLAVWTLALSFAITALVSATSVRRRDVITALPIAIQVWLYVSPVAYPLSSVRGVARDLIEVNPLTALVEAHRWSVTGTTDLGTVALAIGLAATVGLLVAGLAAFRVAERSMADVL
jgi:lipopolysaccharide transport system permease protein